MARQAMTSGARELARVTILIYQAVQPVSYRMEPIIDVVFSTLGTPAMGMYSYDEMVRNVCELWAAQLLNENDPLGPHAGQSIVRVVMDPNDRSAYHFWETEVGQLVFRRNGFPERPATVLEAAACLNVKRQRIQDALKRNTLHPAPGDQALVTRASLYRYHRTRQARLAQGEDE